MMLAALFLLKYPYTMRSNVTEIQYSGFLVDILCYDKCLLSGSPACALDRTNVITDPGAHTVHCLRDIAVCYDSGFVLMGKMEKGNKTMWEIRFRLDKIGNQRALEVINNTTLVKGLMVTATGLDDDTGLLRDAIIQQCNGGVEACDSVCKGCNSSLTFTGVQGTTSYDAVLVHSIFMLIAWLVIAPLAIFLKRYAADISQSSSFCSCLTRKDTNGFPVAFKLHKYLMLLAVILTCVGVSIALHYFNWRAVSGHGVIGVIVFGLALWQPMPALLCRPEQDSPNRKAFNYVHRAGGVLLLILAVTNVFLGVKNYRVLWNPDAAKIFRGICYALLAIWILVTCFGEYKHTKVQKAKKPLSDYNQETTTTETTTTVKQV